MSTIVLPDVLAPSKRAAVLALFQQFTPLTDGPHYPARMRRRRPQRSRCHFCHAGGKLGGHHLADGTVVWTHRSCHRHHHRAESRPALATA